MTEREQERADVVRAVPIVPDDAGINWFRSLTTNRLKQLWDDDRFHMHCDEIHAVMNERGEGIYVAV